MAIYTTTTPADEKYLVIKSRNRAVLDILDLSQNTIIHIAEQAELELSIGEGEYNHNLNIILTKGAKLKILEQENWSGTINWTIDLIEPYSEIEYITRLEVKNKSKNTIKVNHQASYTMSKVDSRYCVISQNKIQQHTIINIPEGINSCQASQSAEILLLTDRPQVQVIPELRVATDNSNASHGVSIHSIRETDIFYLMARGISQTKAIKILKKGFLEG
jgi:Fe-S cluster assembly scaffold protein SufB